MYLFLFVSKIHLKSILKIDQSPLLVFSCSSLSWTAVFLSLWHWLHMNLLSLSTKSIKHFSNDSRNNTALISRVGRFSRGESKCFNEILKCLPTDTLKRCYWKIREIFSITFFKQCNNVIIIIYNLFDLQNQLFSKIKFISIFLLTN